MPTIHGFDWTAVQGSVPLQFGTFKKCGTVIKADAPFEAGYLPSIFPMVPPATSDAPLMYSLTEPRDTDYHLVMRVNGRKLLLQTGMNPQGKFTLSGLPEEYRVIQANVFTLSPHHYRMYFWAHFHGTPRKVRLLMAESEDYFHWYVANNGRPVLWHHSDCECQAGLVPVSRQCNDATTLYPLPDGRWEIFSASLIRIHDTASRYCKQDIWHGYVRIVQRWVGDGADQWEAPEIVLCPDSQDTIDLQMYELCATRLSDYSVGFMGHYFTGKQKLQLEPVYSLDRRHWVRDCRGALPLSEEGLIVVPAASMASDGDDLLLYYTANNFDHNFNCESGVPTTEIRLAKIGRHSLFGRSLNQGALRTPPLRICQEALHLYSSPGTDVTCHILNGFGEAFPNADAAVRRLADDCMEVVLKNVPLGDVIVLECQGQGTLFDLIY